VVRKSNTRKLFEVRGSEIHGRGVFALADIPKGTRLVEYRGERITGAQMDARYATDSSPHTFVFSLSDGGYLDATVGGNDARFINHSCKPNCESIEAEGRIYIDSRKAIRKGEELSFDYCIVLAERHTKARKALYGCRCGKRGCKGTMLAEK
jgi:SET domain-containing protein